MNLYWMKEILKNKAIKGLIITLLVLSIFYILFSVLYRILYEGMLTENEISFFISSIKDLTNVLFFCLIGVITILSYLQARKTLFTPIKTETFKMQISAFEEILNFFQSKSETDFTEQFDFSFIFNANAKIMFSNFLKTFYKDEIKINDGALKELRSNFVAGVVTASYAEKFFEKPEYFEKVKKKEEQDVTNPAIILAQWKKYEHGMIKYTKKFHDETEKLSKLISSPLLPNELKEKVEDFEKNVRQQLYSVGEVLTQVAQELPEKFPTTKSIKNFELTGLWNLYNTKCGKLEPKAQEILIFIREYLKIDTLIK